MSILILGLLGALALSTIATRIMLSEDQAPKLWLTSNFSCMIAILILTVFYIIGVFTLIARFDGYTMQPNKGEKYELIQEPIYKKIK